MLTERLELRIDEETMRLLRDEAGWRGVSMGELVRDAVSSHLADDRRRRMAAAETLCTMDDLDVGDWEVMERELADSMTEGLG